MLAVDHPRPRVASASSHASASNNSSRSTATALAQQCSARSLERRLMSSRFAQCWRTPGSCAGRNKRQHVDSLRSRKPGRSLKNTRPGGSGRRPRFDGLTMGDVIWWGSEELRTPCQLLRARAKPRFITLQLSACATNLRTTGQRHGCPLCRRNLKMRWHPHRFTFPIDPC